MDEKSRRQGHGFFPQKMGDLTLMKYDIFEESFRTFIADCPEEPLDPDARYVFLSDLHMGNGGSRDDLAPNRALIEAMLERWYLDRDYYLILNGDIEDVSKFPLRAIETAWPKLLETIKRFAERGKLRKIVGNHDYDLLARRDYPWSLLPGLVYRSGENKLFVFHGHQASSLYVKYDYVSDFLIRYFARPLRIKNSGVSKDSHRRFRTEKRIYRAARTLGVIAVTGHTHRPLFESQAKYDRLRIRIEELLLLMNENTPDMREVIRTEIQFYLAEMQTLADAHEREKKTQSLYGGGPFLIPCIFNSGCATGKHGITALEIENGEISLVYWMSSDTTRPYITSEALDRATPDGVAFRYTLQRDRLDAIFTRIEILGQMPEGRV
jgi:UDP-2,3-diacylglucosamine pyrophosphatase LpxH